MISNCPPDLHPENFLVSKLVQQPIDKWTLLGEAGIRVRKDLDPAPMKQDHVAVGYGVQ